MATYILNKYHAVKLDLNPNEYNVMIRVTSPGEEFLPLENKHIYDDILELRFYDFIKETQGLTIFNEHHLDMIMNFFKRHKNCKNMVIHCDEGMSRSAGIAIGWFLFNDNRSSIYNIYHNKKHIPNKLIVESFYKRLHKSMKYLKKWEKEKFSS